jgi:hypothetical protein
MGVATFQQGLRDLTSGVNTYKGKKAARAAAEAEQVARQDLSNTLSESAAGMTSTGQFVSKGLASGLLDAPQSLNAMKGVSRYEMFAKLQERALVEKDPAERRNLQQVVAQVGPMLDRINEDEAYHKSFASTSGRLEARKRYGVLHPPRKGSKSKNGTDGFATGPDGTLPVGVNMGVAYDDVLKYVSNSDIYQFTKGINNKTAFLSIPNVDIEDQKDFRAGLTDAIRGSLKKSYRGLPASLIDDLANNGARTFMQQGLQSFESVGSSGQNIFGRDLVEDIYLFPEEIEGIPGLKDSMTAVGRGKKRKLIFRDKGQQRRVESVRGKKLFKSKNDSRNKLDDKELSEYFD